MKKILSSILVFIMLVGCVFTLASCSRPELDLATAKSNLEAKGFTVILQTNKDYLSEGIVQKLTAYDGLYSDEGQYLNIIVFDNTKTAKIALEEQEIIKKQSKENLEYQIELTEHLLKTYRDELSTSEIADYEDEIKEYEDVLATFDDEFILGRKGKTIWYGTKLAIEASNGK